MDRTAATDAAPRDEPDKETARPLRVLPPMAHVQFCFYCEMFTIPLGAMERCPECGAVYPRE